MAYRFARKSKSRNGDDTARTKLKSKQAANEAEPADDIERAKKEFIVRQDDYDAALGHLTPMTPGPGRGARNVFRGIDVLRFLANVVIGMGFGFAELDAAWNQDFDIWRIYTGVLALIYVVSWTMVVAGMVMNFLNERFVEFEFRKLPDSNKDPDSDDYINALAQVRDRIHSEPGADGHITLPYLNAPVPRVGTIYLTIMSVLFTVNWVYFYKYLNTGDGIHPVTFNDERGFRVFIWIHSILATFDVVVALVDYFELIHVGMEATSRERRACVDIHCAMMDEGKPGGHSDYPDLDKLYTAQQLIQWLSIAATILVVGYLAERLVLGPDDLWSVPTQRYVSGISAAICAFFVLMHFIAWYMAMGHACTQRVIRDGLLYWLFFMFGLGTVWYYQVRFSNDNRTPVVPGTADQQSQESYIWVMLLFYSLHLFYTGFHMLRCFVSQTMQRVWCPNLYGF